jgi:hypothetical protein
MFKAMRHALCGVLIGLHGMSCGTAVLVTGVSSVAQFTSMHPRLLLQQEPLVSGPTVGTRTALDIAVGGLLPSPLIVGLSHT